MEYNETANLVTWRKHDKIIGISMSTVSATDGQITYLTGGYLIRKKNHRYHSFAYNPVTQKKKALAPVPFAVTGSMAVYYDGFIYLPGGKAEGHGNSILRYNIEDNFWAELNVTLKYAVTKQVCALIMSGGDG